MRSFASASQGPKVWNAFVRQRYPHAADGVRGVWCGSRQPSFARLKAMRLLVIGGGWFLGRAIVEAASGAGHEVTVFNRGRTSVDLPASVRHVRGDRERESDLRRLAGAGPWDAAIDVPGVVPAQVRDAARHLARVARQYMFVSTVSAYRDWPAAAVSEDSSLHDAAPDANPDDWEWGTGVYGPLKAGAEAAVRREFGAERTTIVRPGVILGPYEYGGRLTWWLRRAAHGGRMVAPGSPHRPIRPVDVRDLAAFIVKLAENGVRGVFNVAGPLDRDTFGGFLAACLTATGDRGEVTWVDDEWLQTHGVREWVELPLWRTAPGTWRIDTERAEEAGLACRPLRQTVSDTWTWLAAGGQPVDLSRQSMHGLHPERETALLAAWDEFLRNLREEPADERGPGNPT
jgi:2'-hydroxyisoflavone reductase